MAGLTDKGSETVLKIWGEIKRNKTAYMFVAPYYTLFLVFTVIPVVISMALSFTYYNTLEPPRFIGWANFVKLFFNDDIFLMAVKNTFVFAAVTGPLSYIICLFLAWLINDLSPKVRAFFTFVFYAPSLSGSVFMIWQLMFSGDGYGYVNGYLLKLGIIKDPIQWLQDPKYMMAIIMLVSLWLSLGTAFLAFIAGFQGIDGSLYEAGAVDGVKNRWQELWYITLPAMKPMLLFGAVMQITASFAVSDVCEGLAGFPSVDYAAHTIVTHMKDYGLVRFDMGYAAAIATLLFLAMFGTNQAVNRLLKKVGT